MVAPWWELVQAGVLGGHHSPQGHGHVTGGGGGSKLVPVEHVLGECMGPPHRIPLLVRPKCQTPAELHHGHVLGANVL